jgi:hypothetical protein
MVAYDNINDACIIRNIKLLLDDVNNINKNNDIKKRHIKKYKALIELFTYLNQDYTIDYVKRNVRIRNVQINKCKEFLYKNYGLALLEIPINYKKKIFKLVDTVYQKIKL